MHNGHHEAVWITRKYAYRHRHRYNRVAVSWLRFGGTASKLLLRRICELHLIGQTRDIERAIMQENLNVNAKHNKNVKRFKKMCNCTERGSRTSVCILLFFFFSLWQKLEYSTHVMFIWAFCKCYSIAMIAIGDFIICDCEKRTRTS